MYFILEQGLFYICFVVQILALIIPVLISVAYFTLLERKLLAAVQKRRGPNLIGLWGLLQPIADGLKLILKENILVIGGDKLVFFLTPMLTFLIAMANWLILTLGEQYNIFFFDLGILYFFALSSIGAYTLILAGWASNSRYAFLGSLRSAAQMVSYEVAIGLVLMNIILITGSLNLYEIVEFQRTCWLALPLFPSFIFFFIICLAETGRTPFDLPEAEGELVAGYGVEFSAFSFAFFVLAENANILLNSSLISILFLGGWHFLGFSGPIISILKIVIILICIIHVRALLPRYRYDQLMALGWKVFLPLSLCNFFFLSALINTIF